MQDERTETAVAIPLTAPKAVLSGAEKLMSTMSRLFAIVVTVTKLNTPLTPILTGQPRLSPYRMIPLPSISEGVSVISSRERSMGSRMKTRTQPKERALYAVEMPSQRRILFRSSSWHRIVQKPLTDRAVPIAEVDMLRPLRCVSSCCASMDQNQNAPLAIEEEQEGYGAPCATDEPGLISLPHVVA